VEGEPGRADGATPSRPTAASHERSRVGARPSMTKSKKSGETRERIVVRITSASALR